MSEIKKIRIMSTGFAKQAIADAAKKAGGELVEIEIHSDMAGARKVKSGEADYYIGSCWSGHGGALSIAIGVLGYSNCTMVTTASGHPTPEQIKNKVKEKDWKAFGINAGHAPTAVPHIIDALLEKNGLK
ncbi:DUF2620 family protein [Neobacillus pocheonensis]|uniref:DUF2620 family protein n=1 Tax=Neobacillus pocheonensis TaxID=363869 RepID=UPI003D2A1C81